MQAGAVVVDRTVVAAGGEDRLALASGLHGTVCFRFGPASRRISPRRSPTMSKSRSPWGIVDHRRCSRRSDLRRCSVPGKRRSSPAAPARSPARYRVRPHVNPRPVALKPSSADGSSRRCSCRSRSGSRRCPSFRFGSSSRIAIVCPAPSSVCVIQRRRSRTPKRSCRRCCRPRWLRCCIGCGPTGGDVLLPRAG